MQQGDWISILQNQVRSLRYGLVQITVYESRVVQIATTEKIRLDADILRGKVQEVILPTGYPEAALYRNH